MYMPFQRIFALVAYADLPGRYAHVGPRLGLRPGECRVIRPLRCHSPVRAGSFSPSADTHVVPLCECGVIQPPRLPLACMPGHSAPELSCTSVPLLSHAESFSLGVIARVWECSVCAVLR